MNPKKVRRLLKTGRAVIEKYDPFTIRLTYETTKETQKVELSVDAGANHIGISLKSEKHEYIHEQRDTLPDEKQHHEAQLKNRQTRRNRKRYRKPRFENRRVPEKWLAPSVRHKKDLHVSLCERYIAVAPVADVCLEVGTFDTYALELKDAKNPVPEGIDYQKGPQFGYDNLREAVFYRDNYTCQVCQSTIGKIKTKDGYKAGTVILRMHHIGYRNGDHSNRITNLITVCTKCHTSANHKPGGKLWNLEPVTKPLNGTAFMNTVRWYMYEELTDRHPDIRIHLTYGAVTKRKRIGMRLEKTHANDAYCIGMIHPKHRAHEAIYQKNCRNNRCLERFYDAKVVDVRTGETVSGRALGCERTNRSESRRSDKNLRVYRGQKVRKGYRSIRKQRHLYQAGDIVIYKGKKHVVKTCRTKTNKSGTYETVEFTDMPKQIKTTEVKLYRYLGEWKRTA